MTDAVQPIDSTRLVPPAHHHLFSLSLLCLGALSSLALTAPISAQSTPATDLPAGQMASQSAPSNNTPQSALSTAVSAETLGSNDLVEVRVSYCPELSHSFRIGPNGALVLPLLRQPIQVAGLTPGQSAAEIRQALITQQIMPDPVVNVSVLEMRSRPVSVVGAVVHPLTFQAIGDITLLEAIAMAGGFAPGGATTILISSQPRGAAGTLKVSVQEIPVRTLLLHANPELNIPLRGGEEIRVTEAAKVFVAGNVAKPGAYTMQGDEDTTVLKALALSSGLQPYSAHVAYIYRRRPPGKDREEIRVQLARIMARKEPDVDLVADDILYIPDNNGKRITARVLAQIAGFSQTTATGLLIYR